jgi:UDP-3-O-[3-hydroxymyristoyl] glucosamine N-acyltransferase
VIGEGVSLGDRVWIGASTVVGDGVAIGTDSRLFPNVTAYSGTRVGERTFIHAGVRLGSDGFGYAFRDGVHHKIPHVGRCLIGNDVEIGANSTVDRGSIDDTVIGDGTKIDNLCQVAHNVRIGRLCLLMSQVGISGSTRLEDGVVFTGQSGAAGHLTIGKGAMVGAKSAVWSDIPAGEVWSGSPARLHRDSLRAHAATLKLAEFMKRVERFMKGKGS